MSRPKIIAIYSPAPQAGKSTLAGFLEESGYRRTPFAEPLKRIVGSLLHSTGCAAEEAHERLYGALKEDPVEAFNNLSTRDVMQLFGTEFGRDMINPDLWVLIMRQRIHNAREYGINLVIDDLRFPNEYSMLKSEGAMLVKIAGPRMLKPSEHRSDGALEGYEWHLHVENNGSPGQLRAVAAGLIGETS